MNLRRLRSLALTAVLALLHCGDLSDEASSDSLSSGGSASATAHTDSGALRAEPDATEDATMRQPVSPAAQSWVIRITEQNPAVGPNAEAQASQDGGYAQQWGLDAGLAVSAEAGVLSAELAWLVAHMMDGADTAGPAGPSGVRALIARGAPAIAALLPLFAGGDARRVPLARLVVQESLLRECRAFGGGDQARRMVRWFETGTVVGAIDPRARWRWPWMRGPEFGWSPLAMRRLRAWVGAGLSCDLRQIEGLADAGLP
jgi:hypothetical protein